MDKGRVGWGQHTHSQVSAHTYIHGHGSCRVGPTLVVAPLSVLAQWHREIQVRKAVDECPLVRPHSSTPSPVSLLCPFRSRQLYLLHIHTQAFSTPQALSVSIYYGPERHSLPPPLLRRCSDFRIWPLCAPVLGGLVGVDFRICGLQWLFFGASRRTDG